MSEKNDKNLESPELTLDDLDDVAGGNVIRYSRHGRTLVNEYVCPKCGSQSLEGIQDGRGLPI